MVFFYLLRVLLAKLLLTETKELSFYILDSTHCETDQFQCKNGKCISANLRCDDRNDCGDLTDETACPTRSTGKRR